MINILYIGSVDKNGHFTCENLNEVINWLHSNCDNIRTYTKLNIKQIKDLYGNNIEIEEEELIDLNLNYSGYRITGLEKSNWDKIATSSYQIDDGISHIYFLNGEMYKAELVIEDCDNVVQLNLTKEEEESVILMMPKISSNIENCKSKKEKIDDLLNGEVWKPLGNEE